MLEYMPGVGLTPIIDEELYLREVVRLLDRAYGASEREGPLSDTAAPPVEIPTTRDEEA